MPVTVVALSPGRQVIRQTRWPNIWSHHPLHFLRPTGPPVDGYTAKPLPAQTESADVATGEAQRFVRDLDIPGQWWTL